MKTAHVRKRGAQAVATPHLDIFSLKYAGKNQQQLRRRVLSRRLFTINPLLVFISIR